MAQQFNTAVQEVYNVETSAPISSHNLIKHSE